MGEKQEEVLDKLKNVLLQVDNRKKKKNLTLLQRRGKNTYMTIGHFIFMKNQDSSPSLHVFDFEESIEKSEHQWIGQILIKSLGNLGKVTVIPPKYDHILAAHGLDNYFAQVANCLTSGVHDNLMQWKLATDVEKSQEIQLKLVADMKKMLEKINGPPQQNGNS